MCSVGGCERTAKARGYCLMHYKRWRSTGDPGPAEPKRKDSKPPAPCSIEGCGKPGHARGWCQGHYSRWKNAGDPGTISLAVVRYNGQPCSVEECKQGATSLGLCDLHYARQQRAGKPGPSTRMRAASNVGQVCSLDGCERPRRAGGYCTLHYDRVRKSGDPGPIDPVRVAKYSGEATCTVEGCTKSPASRGLCDAHYQRWQKHGDPLGGNKSPAVLKAIDHADGTRTCTECGQRKPLNAFGVDRNATLGRRSKCKPCRSAMVRGWYDDNRERQRDRQRARYSDDLDTARERDRQRYERDREKRIALANSHTDKRRARLAGVKYQAGVTRANLRKQYGDACFYCGVHMVFTVTRKRGERPDGLATVEHLIPISAGGEHSWENVVLACWRCNISKNRKDLAEWLGPRIDIEAEIEGDPA